MIAGAVALGAWVFTDSGELALALMLISPFVVPGLLFLYIYIAKKETNTS